MSARKILFLDVDGTITDYENNIPASCVAAIQPPAPMGTWPICVRVAARPRYRPSSRLSALTACSAATAPMSSRRARWSCTSSSPPTSAVTLSIGYTVAASSSTSRATTACSRVKTSAKLRARCCRPIWVVRAWRAPTSSRPTTSCTAWSTARHSTATTSTR